MFENILNRSIGNIENDQERLKDQNESNQITPDQKW